MGKCTGEHYSLLCNDTVTPEMTMVQGCKTGQLWLEKDGSLLIEPAASSFACSTLKCKNNSGGSTLRAYTFAQEFQTPWPAQSQQAL
jgi:hypothetical protein